MSTWRTRTTRDLLEFIAEHDAADGREPAAPSSTWPSPRYILQANGAPAGHAAVDADDRGADRQRRRPARRRPPQPRRATRPRRAPADGRAARRRRGGAAPADAAARRRRRRPLGLTVTGDGEELRAGHRRDAAQSGSRRLADGAAQLSGLELQPADADHARQRQGSAARVGVGDERGRREPADAARAQRRSMYLTNTEQHRAGARREDRRADLGEPRRPERDRSASRRCATWRSTRTRSSSRPPTRGWSRSTRAPARWSGTRRSPIARRATRTPPGRSSSRARSSRAWSAAIATATTAASSAPTTRPPASSCGSSTPSRARDEPGGDTWGKLADNLRAGGETWITGSYDPDLNLTYWGIAQAKPWMRASRGTIELRQRALHQLDASRCMPKDGKLAWHYQHAPGESLDLDEVFERVLVDIGDQKLVFTIGKPGILWKLDRADRRSSSATRKRSSRTSSSRSIRRPACRHIAPTSSSSRSASGCSRARAPKAGTTGRR